MRWSFTITGAALLLSACAAPDFTPTAGKKADPAPKTVIESPKTSNYVSIVTPRKRILDAKVTINQTFALMDALTLPFALSKANVVVRDTGVNTHKIISVKAQNSSIADYIAQIEGLTDYKIDIISKPTSKAPTLHVASTVTKTWDLAALSDMPQVTDRAGFSATSSNSSTSQDESSGISSGSGTEVVILRNDDSWDLLLEDVREILGVDEDENDTNNTAINNPIQPMDLGGSVGLFGGPPQLPLQLTPEGGLPFVIEPWVVGNKRLGKITAYAKPSVISRVDKYLGVISKESQRQVHIKASILSVSTTKGDGYGINWDAIYKNGDKSFSIIGKATQALSLVDGGTWTIAASIPFGDLTLSSLISSLQEQGSVQLLGQPRLTVTNGYTAYLGSTQEFSFVSGIEFLPLATAGGGSATTDTAVSTELSRVNIGIKIAVTPRLLDNGKILLDVLPILSSVQGFTEIESGGTVFETPNIALQELSTQVITSSGTPIYLGGLIVNKLIQNAKNVPLKSEALRKALGSATYEEENTELLIAITAQEVGA